MAASTLEQYRIADFLEWYDKQQLKLNPDFQRGDVWTGPAKVYLIDTILRQLPMPKIYLRSLFDTDSKKSYREVVDGQQRLRAIIDFSRNKFKLSKRALEFEGLTYATMSHDMQTTFLTYPIAVDQLINASVDDVIDIFGRLNSYTVNLNPAEQRHAEFQGEFRWSVHLAASKWNILWDEFKVVSVRERVRLLHDSLMAEMFGVLLEGVSDGGAPKITALYRRHDRAFSEQESIERKVDATLQFIIDNFGELLLSKTALSRSNHFLILFAASAHALFGIPNGEVGDDMPARPNIAKFDAQQAAENLSVIASYISADVVPSEWQDFWLASQSSTQRIKSRRTRFPVFCRALDSQPL